MVFVHKNPGDHIVQLRSSVHIFQLQFSDVEPRSGMGTRPNRPSLNIRSLWLTIKKNGHNMFLKQQKHILLDQQRASEYAEFTLYQLV